MRDLCHDLAQERSRRAVLPRILDAAIELTEAERGFLVLVKAWRPDGSPKLRVEVARGFDKASLGGVQGSVSRTVVERVLRTPQQGLVSTRPDDAQVLDASSIQARRVVAVACAALQVQGRVLGALYLDHRFHPDAFRASDLPALRTFADQAALALQAAEQAEREQLRQEPPGPPASAAAAGPPDPSGQPSILPGLGELRGSSPAMQRLYRELIRAAPSSDPVLIWGESGSGKEVAARVLHEQSPRRDLPLVIASCRGDDDEIRAQLFGPGGAWSRAGAGSLVLDETDRLGPRSQAELLTRLRQPGPCRLLALSQADLSQLVAQGALLDELFYRLDVLRLRLPPLRERQDDAAQLLCERLAELSPGPDLSEIELTPRARQLLVSYSWPGNVRELENECRRLALEQRRRVRAQDLSPEIRSGRGVTTAAGALSGHTLSEASRALIEAALRDADGNKARAARMLGVPRSTLYGLLRRYGLG